MSYLDQLLNGIKNVAIAGLGLPTRQTINFKSGATAVDNPATGSTDVTITGSSTTFAGDLSGTSASQTVVGIQGRPVQATAPVDAAVYLFQSGPGSWAPARLSGDVTVSDTGAASTQGLLGVPLVYTGGGPYSTQSLVYSGTAWTNVSTSGGSTTLAGDVVGTTAANRVASISGNPSGGVVPVLTSAFNLTSNALTYQFASTTRFAVEQNHGVGTFGAGGADYKATIGPHVGVETSYAAVHLLAGATARTINNYVLQSDGAALAVNAPGAVGVLTLGAGGSQYASISGADGALKIFNGSQPATPSGGGKIFCVAGATKVIGTSGTVTTIGPADPHCPVCGRDFVTEHESEKYGYLSVCLSCLADELGERPWIVRRRNAAV